MDPRKVIGVLIIYHGCVHSLQTSIKPADRDLCNYNPNSTDGVQCYCSSRDQVVDSADCWLTKQNVDSNDLSWSYFKSLKTVKKLTFLKRGTIGLTYIPTDAFQQLRELTLLDIKNANINTVQAFAFGNLSNLIEIRLSNNGIRELLNNAFSNHEKLATITMDTNELKEIKPNVFINLPVLKSLYLTSNAINKLHDGALQALTALEQLEINKNSITTLTKNTFNGLSSLNILDLSENEIEIINSNIFSPLVSLKSLDLSGNRIKMLNERPFESLSMLASLSISHNKLRNDALNQDTFNGLPNLESLDLSYNELNSIQGGIFTKMKALSSLNLEKNKLNHISDEAFEGLNRLRSLDLRSNNLTYMTSARVFASLKTLEYLKLKHNGMRELAEDAIKPIVANFYKRLSLLEFGDNNFPCDCRLNWFLRLKNKTQNKELELAIENLQCIPSPELKAQLAKYDEEHKESTRTEEGNTDVTGNDDFEYYDEPANEGFRFYFDIPEALVPCPEEYKRYKIQTPPELTSPKMTAPANQILVNQQNGGHFEISGKMAEHTRNAIKETKIDEDVMVEDESQGGRATVNDRLTDHKSSIKERSHLEPKSAANRVLFTSVALVGLVLLVI